MEKRDMIVIIVAIFIVLIMAMYIKPLVTGKEAKLIPDEISGLFKGSNNTSVQSGNNTSYNFTPNLSGLNNNTSAGNTTGFDLRNISKPDQNGTKVSPTPTLWDGSPIQVGYTYTGQNGGLVPRTGPVSQDQPYSFLQKPEMTLFTEFQGKYPISSDTFEIPKTAGYWEIEYTVDYEPGLQEAQGSEKSGDYPVFQFNKERKIVVEDGVKEEKVITKGGEWEEEDYSGSGVFVESYSIVVPSIKIQVVKHDQNNSKVIRTITPGGGLDPYLWNKAVIKEKLKENAEMNDIDIDDDVLEEKVKYIVDPRPWVEKIYERGNFSIIVQPSNLKSYDIKIKMSKGISAAQQNQPKVSINPLNATIFKYVQFYNSDTSNPSYISDILSIISFSPNDKNQLSQRILQSRSAVPQITQYNVYSTDMSNGNFRGDIHYDLNGQDKWMPLDIYLVYTNNTWMLPDPILPRY